MEIILQSERIFFREFTTDDTALILALNSDPEVVKYVHEEPITDLNMALANITNRIIPQYHTYGYGRWAAILKDTNAFIGWCGLKYRPERNEVDLGYRFIQSQWNKGYATESALAALKYGFEKLNIPSITAMAHIENTPSLKVIEKCGMHFQQFEQVEGCPVKVFRLNNPSQPANG